MWLHLKWISHPSRDLGRWLPNFVQPLGTDPRTLGWPINLLQGILINCVLFKKFYFIYLSYVCVCMPVWKSEDNFWESAFLSQCGSGRLNSRYISAHTFTHWSPPGPNFVFSYKNKLHCSLTQLIFAGDHFMLEWGCFRCTEKKNPLPCSVEANSSKD